MATELQPPPQISIPPPPAVEPTTSIAPSSAPPPLSDNPPPPVAPKRQRQPSVRLGEIGDQPATLRTKNPWSHHRNSRTRPITNLDNGHDFHDDGKRMKTKRGLATKRFRSNWVSKVNNGADGDNCDQSVKFRAFDVESDSPVKGNSLVNSGDNIDAWDRRAGDDGVELDTYPVSDSRERRCGSSERVRSFLINLGLSRYMPVFKIHEVDDEVLPLLTLEDLKDMGINAVGSRRKMYASIQKLRCGYSSIMKLQIV